MLTGAEPEADLVARCRAGDQEAFHDLVETHHARVYRTAYAVVGDPHAAAEVEQDVFVKSRLNAALGRLRQMLVTERGVGALGRTRGECSTHDPSRRDARCP